MNDANELRGLRNDERSHTEMFSTMTRHCLCELILLIMRMNFRAITLRSCYHIYKDERFFGVRSFARNRARLHNGVIY